MLFNKQITEEKFNEINNKIRDFNFYPKQTNAFELLKKAGEWSAIETQQLTTKDFTEDWANIPEEMLEYIKGLKEFDKDIFKEITGLDIDNKAEELTMEEVCKELGRTIKIKK